MADKHLQIVTAALYDIFLNPNAKYPGPFLCKITYLKFYHEYWKLNQTEWLADLHRKYGKLSSCFNGMTPHRLSI